MQNNLTRRSAHLRSFAANLIAKWGIVFFVVLAALCGQNNTATGQTFTSSAGITGASGSATPVPYPSTITVSGVVAPITSVIVGVNGITSASFPDPFSLLLVGPGGQNIVLLAGEGTQATAVPSNVNLIFEDQGSFVTSGNLNSGTYRPTSSSPGNYTFPSPAPSGPYNLPGSGGQGNPTLASVFGGTNANGVWNLYAVYDGEAFTISSWALTITQVVATPTTTSISSSINPSFTTAPNNTVTYTATVTSGGSPVTSGVVIFKRNDTTITSATNGALNGSGQTSVTTTFATAGPYPIHATYSGNSSFSSSSASLTQQVNLHPTTLNSIIPGSNYSNAGSIQYTVNFGASVNGLSASNFSLTTSGVTGAAITSVSPPSGSTNTVTVNTGTGDGTIGLNLINAAGLTPGISTSLPFTGGTTTIDKTPPVVTIGAPSTTSTSTGPVSFDVSFSDAHFNSTLFNQTNVTVNSTGTANYSQVSTLQNSATDFTVTVAGISGNGTLGISIQPGTSQDLAGNTDIGAGPSAIVNVMPMPTISYTSPQVYAINSPIAPLIPVETISTAAFASTTAGTGLAIDYNGNAYIVSSTSEIIEYPPGNTTTFPLPANSSANIAVAPISATSNTLLFPFNGSFRAMDIAGGFNPPVTICPTSGSGNLVAATHPVSGPEIAMINKGFDPGGQIAFLTRTAGVWSSPGIITNAFPGSAMAINNYPGGLKLAYVGTDNNLYYAAYSGGSWSAVMPWATPNIGMTGVVAFALDAQGNVWYANGASLNELSPGSSTPVTVATLPSAPNAISFDIAGNLYVNLGTIIEKLTVINNFQVSPGLPSGLNIDSNTGAISGTPTAVTTPTNYTVTASAGGFNLTASVNILIASTNADLSNLHLSNGALSPAFSGTTTSYTAPVGNGVTSMTVTPTTSDANATIKVNGITVTSGTASSAIPLVVGPNTITMVVTAQDGVTTKTYTLTVTRVPSSNAKLALIQLSRGTTLSPVFAAATTSYTASVASTISSITVKPTAVYSTTTITVNGTAVTSGTASSAIPLTVGNNTITVIGTAQDGVTKMTYTVTVTRISNNPKLALIHLSSGTLSPAFAAATTGYTASVANTISSITVKPTAVYSTTTITVNGTAVTSGTASSAIPLSPGPNTITLISTAQDGVTTMTYTVTVTRISSNAKLALIHLSSGTLSPTFAAATTSYTASETNATTSITVTPTAVYSTTTITVNGTAVSSGTASSAIPLSVGPNTITLVTTAQDGVTTMTYTVTVTRATGPVPIANNNFTNSFIGGQGDGITVHQGVSPNGDGENDILTIDGITNYPDNKLMIMNRNGVLVFEAKGYDNSFRVFDGHSNKNGKMQQPGTYFYSLEYKAGGVNKRKTGFIVLKW
jgi:gliding motility-associated-like protein